MNTKIVREQGEWIGSIHRDTLTSSVYYFGGKLYEASYLDNGPVSVYEGNVFDLFRGGQTIRDRLGDE